MNGIARDVGDDVARAVDARYKGKLPNGLAVCGSYLVEVATQSGEIIVSVRVPLSLLSLLEED